MGDGIFTGVVPQAFYKHVTRQTLYQQASLEERMPKIVIDDSLPDNIFWDRDCSYYIKFLNNELLGYGMAAPPTVDRVVNLLTFKIDMSKVTLVVNSDYREKLERGLRGLSENSH